MKHACKFDNCQFVFDRPSKLKRHEECHLGMKSFTCREEGCSKSYSTSSHLKRHFKTFHVRSEKSDVYYTCSYSTCNSVFNTPCGLRKHEKKHLTGHYCDACNRFFGNKLIFHKHLDAHQSKQRRNSNVFNKFMDTTNEIDHSNLYICEECDLSFQNKQKFISHCKNCHEPLSINYYCGELDCRKIFRHKKNLKEHIRRCHLEASMFICGEVGCIKIFRHKRNLTKHIMVKHLNIVLKCPVEKCNRIFHFKKSLRYHIRQHEHNLLREKKTKESKKSTSLAQQLAFSIVNFVD